MSDDEQLTRPPTRNAGNAARPQGKPPRRDAAPSANRRRDGRGPTRAARQGNESFKCVHCKAFIGPTVSGGKHRNHCPRCLYSRHVDETRPGDRASRCQSAMAPIGRFERPNGEPVILHRCLGCGFERHNRLAADDNWDLYESLPIVTPRIGAVTGQVETPPGE